VAERRLPFGSVRARITAVATAVVAVVLVVVSGLLVVTQRAGLVEQLDEALELEAEQLAAATGVGGSVPTLDDDDDRLVAVIRRGDIVAATAEADADEVAALAGADDGAATIDGEEHRVARAEDGSVEIVVAASTEDIAESVADLVRTLLVMVPVATAVLAAAVWILVGRTLRPVERIRAGVAAIGSDDLHRRVPQPPGTDEIARLAETMNDMLERLDRANQRQQRFVADASHELRTPLTRIRAELELDERHPDRADPAATRRSVLHDVATLQRLIDDLLLLARADAGATGAESLVDLDDVVVEEAQAIGGVDVRHVSAAQVRGDPAALRRVVRNLLDNAHRHAAGTVAATLSEAGARAHLVIDDDGPGIPPDRRDEVFERFTRLDDARTPIDGRSGLGLSIVRAVVSHHGGTVEIDDSPLGGTRVTVTLPLA
jgi:signal transduction histidine kinase